MSYRGSWPTSLSYSTGNSSRDAENWTHARFQHGQYQLPARDLPARKYSLFIKCIHVLSRFIVPLHRIGSGEYRGPLSPSSVTHQRPAPVSTSRPRLNLWSTFRVRDKAFYTFGRAFRIAPYERAGDVTNQNDEKFVTLDCFGRQVICKPRICIVVEEHKGFSNVVTINGYGDRSLEKKSTNASEHAVARTELDLSPPSLAEFSKKAEQMLQQPICITPELVGQKFSILRAGSVVDFGRVMSVQHYHEAGEFGFVADESLETLRRYYSNFRNKCSTPKKLGVSKESSINPTSGPILALAVPEATSNYLDPGRTIAWTSPHTTYRTIADHLDDQQMPDVYKYILNSAGTEEERDSGRSGECTRREPDTDRR